MPDTGAPYEIPFLDGTELVRAYPQTSEDLADAIAGNLADVDQRIIVFSIALGG